MDLVAREAEVALLGARLAAARDGDAAFVAIAGEPGIGKTALFDAALAGARGTRVLTARGSELERDFAFGVVRQALEPTVAGRDDLLAGRAELAAAALVQPAGQTHWSNQEGILHGLYWLLAGLAEESPLVLAIDDAHWADAESLAFLRFLALRLAGLRVAVLITTRPEDAVGALLTDPGVETLTPAALDAAETALLLARRLGHEPAPEFARTCHMLTGGTPFLLDQLVHAIAAEGLAPTAGAADRVAALQPEGLSRTIVARLDAAPLALARAVAILGDGVPVGLAAPLAALSLDAADHAADALAAAGVLADARPLRVRHALLRGAVLGGLRAGERSRAHAAAVDLLRDRGASPEVVAAHLLRIEPRGNPRDTATLHEAAGDAQRRGAPETAATLLERALQDPVGDEDRAALLLELGEADWTLGRPEGTDHFIAASQLSDDPFEALIKAGHAAGLDPARGERARELLAGVSARDRTAAVRLLNARLACSWQDIDLCAEIVAEAEALGPLAGDSPAECMLLSQVVRAKLQAGAPADVLVPIVLRAVRHELPEDTTWLVPLMITLATLDRHAEAEALAQRVIDSAQQRGSLRAFSLAMSWQARVAWMRGDLARAESLATSVLDATADEQHWWPMVAAAALVETLIDQGRADDARAAWPWEDLDADVPRHRALNQMLHARARIREEGGDLAGALEDLREMDRRIGPTARTTVNYLATRLRTTSLLHALGEAQEAARDADAVLRLARDFGAPSAVGTALRVWGRVRGDEAALAEAADVLRDCPARLDHARALLDLGAAMRRRGARSDAREPLREAHDLATACDARGVAEEARPELGASGVHVERLRTPGRDALTPSEQRIAAMAADGMTNKEIAQALFLTIKTVEMHLSAAYRKLDVRSRRELPVALGAE